MELVSVTYQKPILVETIFQLRFSPILQIETGMPASFQEIIRHNYPEYSKQNQYLQEISGNVEYNQFVNETRLTTTTIHAFSNPNQYKTVNLTRDFISLQTKKYLGWGPFKDDIRELLEAFTDSYSGFAPTRIGLRYINVLDRDRLEIDRDVPWKSLLNAHYLGLIADDEYGPLISSHDVKTNITLPNNTGINIGVSSLVNVTSNQPCLGLDIDCFSSNISQDINKDVELLHGNCEEFFFYGITSQLHEAMKPA